MAKLLGRAEGGKVDRRAAGGRITRPGTGTSDSILALIDGRKPLLVSNGESIVTGDATAKFWPLIDAMNKGKFSAFSNGGVIGSPSLPHLRSPRLPAAASGGGANRRMILDGQIKVTASEEFDAKTESVSVRTVGAAAEPIMAGAQTRTINKLSRQALPGGLG